MPNIKRFTNIKDNKIENDIKNFLKVLNKRSKVILLPDLHYKRGEMSPTGSVLLTENEVVPCFTHLNVGSGISSWIIKTNNLRENHIEKLFKKLSKTIPERSKKRLKYLPKTFNSKFFEECVFKGAKALVKRNILNKSDLEKLEDNGNFYNFRKMNLEKLFPKDLLQNCKNEFGSLGSGNTFIELNKIKKIFDKDVLEKWNISKEDYLLTIHSGCTAGYINLYFTPRWGIKGKNFLRFEKNKLRYHLINMLDKETILNKSKFFPGSSKYFKLDYPSYDADLYLAAVNGLTNIAVANRIWLAKFFERNLKSVFKSNFKFKLLWDSCHDTIKKLNVKNKKNIFIHRHGANFVKHSNKLPNNHKYKLTGTPVILPSCPGGDTMLLKPLRNINLSIDSICHGTGRKIDRPIARKKFSSKNSLQKIKKGGTKIYYQKTDFSGEDPNAFRGISEILKPLETKKLLKKVLLLKPIAILKG